eukprot:gene44336-54218_t
MMEADGHLVSSGNVGEHVLLEPEQKFEPLPSPATPGTRKRRRIDGEHAGGRAKLTLKDKFDIITFFDQNLDQQNFALIARKYGVSRQAIRRVLVNRDIVLQDYHNNVPQDSKRARTLSPDFVALDERVLEYLASIAAQSNPMLKRNVLPIGIEAVKAKATEIAALLNIKTNKGRATEAPWRASNSWYARFCNRHNFIREPTGDSQQGMSSPPPSMHHPHGHMVSQHMHMVPMHHMHPNMQQSNMHPNMQPSMQPNIPPNMQANMQSSMQANMQANMQPSMQPGMPNLATGDNSSMLAVMMEDHDKQPDMHSLLNLHGGDSSDED